MSTYISDTLAKVAGALTPAVVALGAVYVAVWGYLHCAGKIEEPFVAGLKRIGVLVLVIGVGLHLWLYQEVLVDTFFTAPGQLSAAIVGANDPVTIIDQILFSGSDAGEALLAKAGILDGLSFLAAGIVVYFLVGTTALYVMFLLALSKVALSILLALGPLFIVMLLFKPTRHYFEAWIAQLSNYALIAILTVLVESLLLQLISTAANQAAAAGPGITIALAVRVCLAAGLILLVLRQVMPMAAGLARGISLTSFSVASRAAAWGFGS